MTDENLNYNLEGAARALAAILRADFPEYGWTVTVRETPLPVQSDTPTPHNEDESPGA